MKRQIAVRVWNHKTKEIEHDLGGSSQSFTVNDLLAKATVSENYEVMMDAGIADMRGRPIWEGDVVKFRRGLIFRRKYLTGTIVWHDSECRFAIKWYQDYVSWYENKPTFTGLGKELMRLEVLGNAYENHDLLPEHYYKNGKLVNYI